MSLAQQLAQGVAELGLELSQPTQLRLLDYVALLQKWNKVYSLTSVHEPARMVSEHVLDSLAVAPHLNAATLLDVGSGAGLPGVPLALVAPRLSVTLLDSSQKKAAFLTQAKIVLGIGNVEVVCERAESWRPDRVFEIVISRALSDLEQFVALAGRHVAPGGRLAAMKGRYPREEVARLPAGWRLQQTIALAVPGLHARRHLLLLARE